MEPIRNFAILAALPEANLHSGLETLKAQIEQDIQPLFIAYGSMAFEAFAAIEKERAGRPVEVFLHATESQGDRPLNTEVTWRGMYMGCEAASGGGRYRGKAIHRPAAEASTKANALFWKVSQLQQFPTGMPVAKLSLFRKKTPLQARLVPLEPILIEYPYKQKVWLK